jgi:hypothetical protein
MIFHRRAKINLKGANAGHMNLNIPATLCMTTWRQIIVSGPAFQ